MMNKRRYWRHQHILVEKEGPIDVETNRTFSRCSFAGGVRKNDSGRQKLAG
ncbi:hypothetical protein I656_02863 [Geobacillus sp. WSUCF1]|nr:hypothetical protein I656_02863 [Geobacillus sp. WSUCF1]